MSVLQTSSRSQLGMQMQLQQVASVKNADRISGMSGVHRLCICVYVRRERMYMQTYVCTFRVFVWIAYAGEELQASYVCRLRICVWRYVGSYNKWID
jgi:hypothetical protein